MILQTTISFRVTIFNLPERGHFHTEKTPGPETRLPVPTDLIDSRSVPPGGVAGEGLLHVALVHRAAQVPHRAGRHPRRRQRGRRRRPAGDPAAGAVPAGGRRHRRPRRHRAVVRRAPAHRAGRRRAGRGGHRWPRAARAVAAGRRDRLLQRGPVRDGGEVSVRGMGTEGRGGFIRFSI